MYIPDIRNNYPNFSDDDAELALAHAVREIYFRHRLPPLSLLENGFSQGNATDAEMRALTTTLNADNPNDALDTLNREFEGILQKWYAIIAGRYVVTIDDIIDERLANSLYQAQLDYVNRKTGQNYQFGDIAELLLATPAIVDWDDGPVFDSLADAREYADSICVAHPAIRRYVERND